jgi:hypothetical protein
MAESDGIEGPKGDGDVGCRTSWVIRLAVAVSDRTTAFTVAAGSIQILQ